MIPEAHLHEQAKVRFGTSALITTHLDLDKTQIHKLRREAHTI